MPFEPLRMARPRDTTDQRLFPVVRNDGEPVWERGDTNIRGWRATGLSTCQGGIGNQRSHTQIDAVVYLTDARIVVVSGDYAKGSKFGSASIFGGPIISSAIRTKLDQHRAEREAEGTFLVGQMRHPWTSRVVFSRREGRRGENTVRICGTHTSAFGDRETVMLIAHFDPNTDSSSIAQQVADRVLADRRDWVTTTDDERTRLDASRFTDPHAVAPGTLPSIELSGGYMVSPGSSGHGMHSSRSYQVPSP